MAPLPARLPARARAADLLDALPDYELLFSGAQAGAGGWAAYYACESTSELNMRFGDLSYRIQDLEVCAWRVHGGCMEGRGF